MIQCYAITLCSLEEGFVSVIFFLCFVVLCACRASVAIVGAGLENGRCKAKERSSEL